MASVLQADFLEYLHGVALDDCYVINTFGGSPEKTPEATYGLLCDCGEPIEPRSYHDRESRQCERCGTSVITAPGAFDETMFPTPQGFEKAVARLQYASTECEMHACCTSEDLDVRHKSSV